MQLLLDWFWHLLPANPMVVRVVQGGSQRLRHLWVRMGYLGVLIGLVVIGMLIGEGMGGNLDTSDMAKAAARIFRIIAYGQVIMVCLLAPLFMAGAIAQERSGETYNILLTTPMTNLQIVLGSFFGRLFFIIALLTSGLPLFSILLVFGGVAIRAVFVAFAVSALVALMVGSVAVTLSVMRAGGRKAVFSFVILVAAYLVTTYALDAMILRQFNAIPNRTTWLTPLHPLLVLESSMSRETYSPPMPEEMIGYSGLAQFYHGNPLGMFTLLTGSISFVLLLYSSVMVRHIGTGDSNALIKLRKWLRLDTGGERTRPAREVWANPIAWREANTRGKLASAILARYGFLVLGLVAAGVLLVLHHGGRLPAISGAASAETFLLVLKILLLTELAVIVLVAIYMSAGCVSREREDGTLDLMLTTPITPKYYIWGKLRGLVSYLGLLIAAPVLTLAMVAAYALIGQALGWESATATSQLYSEYGGTRNRTITHGLLLPEAPILMLLMLLPFVALCVAVGMNWSLKARGVLGAVIPTVAIVSVLALVLGFCGMATVGNVVFIGPVINAFSPVTSIWMIVDPWETVSDFKTDPILGRVSMVIAGLACTGGYIGLVYAVVLNMVRNFDQTVRKLSGTG